ncbi:hypothetical protein VNO78_10675 [Psophocarpus tetragonolobus]|uniref:Uncharacterized protein n=1 Tax=Psophocarpus tetragonolobus TaxID=3891 RepID=A0AAN9XMR1_PSOTE
MLNLREKNYHLNFDLSLLPLHCSGLFRPHCVLYCGIGHNLVVYTLEHKGERVGFRGGWCNKDNKQDKSIDGNSNARDTNIKMEGIK